MASACRGSACGRRQRPWLGRRWWLPAVRPQGAAQRPGATGSRGSAHARRHRQPAKCRSKATTPTAGAVAHVDSVQRRHLRRASMAATPIGQGEG
ncbi:hypothetical protein BHM03_00055791 [Ensete ventricosum]|nr:hypothetical protein BHM03_00055791 [Ensete ventricosum]